MDRYFTHLSVRDAFDFIPVDLKIEMGGYIIGRLYERDLQH